MSTYARNTRGVLPAVKAAWNVRERGDSPKPESELLGRQRRRRFATLARRDTARA
jgi:hypothetical protein